MQAAWRVNRACFALAPAALLLGGCAVVQQYIQTDTDNTEPPAELIEFRPEIEVEELWSRNVGSGASKYYLKLRPMIAEGRVYAANRDGRVSAYDAETGDELWTSDTDAPISGGPGGGDGLVLVGSSDGDVVALAAETGEEKWRVKVSSEVLAPINGTLTLVDAKPSAQVAPGDVLFRVLDGRELWIRARVPGR